MFEQNTPKAREAPQTLTQTEAPAPERTHLHDTVISTLVAGMLPLMGSKSRTVAVASTLSITSPSMRAGDPGQLSELRESLWTERADGGEPERSRQTSRSRYGPHTPPKCCPSDGKQHGKFNGRLQQCRRLIWLKWNHSTHPLQLRCFPEWALLPEQRLKSNSCELHPSCLHSPTCEPRLTRCRFMLLIYGCTDRYLAPNWFKEALKENKLAQVLTAADYIFRTPSSEQMNAAGDVLTAQKPQFKVKYLLLLCVKKSV